MLHRCPRRCPVFKDMLDAPQRKGGTITIMKTSPYSRSMIVAALAPLVPLLGLSANAADLDHVSPASGGVSSERLQRIDSAVQEEIDAGRKAGAAEADSVRELSEETLPGLPLLHHPGARWVYGPEHDVQAHLVEHFSGMPVDEQPEDLGAELNAEPTGRTP
jgi:hypothetical protein